MRKFKLLQKLILSNIVLVLLAIPVFATEAPPIVYSEDKVANSDLISPTAAICSYYDYRAVRLFKTADYFFNIACSSGLRLPNTGLNIKNYFPETDSAPYTTDNDASWLLIHLSNCCGRNRQNFTFAELNDMEDYISLMQCKSVALGLPLYSVSKDLSSITYTESQKEEALGYINMIESKFGDIKFIDTNGAKFDWCSNVGIDESYITTLLVNDYSVPEPLKYQRALTNYMSYYDAIRNSNGAEPPKKEDFFDIGEQEMFYDNSKDVGISLLSRVLNKAYFYAEYPNSLNFVLITDRVHPISVSTFNSESEHETYLVDTKKYTKEEYETEEENNMTEDFDSSSDLKYDTDDLIINTELKKEIAHKLNSITLGVSLALLSLAFIIASILYSNIRKCKMNENN